MTFDVQLSPAGRRRARLAWVLGGVFALSACADMSGIESTAQMRDAASLGLPSAEQASVRAAPAWWEALGDAQLNALIEQALRANPSLNMAQARLARARAGVDASEAASGPQLTAAVDATHQLYTTNGAIPAPLAGTVRDSASGQLTGTWELDFFGKNRAALEAAVGSARAAEADVRAARVLLASTVARQYVHLARLHDQIALAQQLLAQREAARQLVQDRVRAGLDTQLELRQSESALPDARLQLEALQEQGLLAQHAMAALIAEPNRALALAVPGLVAMKNIALSAHMPADLLAQRADVSAALWRVEAATQGLAHAKTQFYPNINLVGFAGFSSIGLDRVLNAGSEQWGVGPALRLPVFDAGRLRANLRGKAADLDGAIESYNATVLDAVRDVSSQLASLQSIERQQREQRAAQSLAQSAQDIALQRYQSGLSNYLSVLSTESAVLNQRRQGVDLAARALDTQVALMHALGGGYAPTSPRPAALN